MEIIEERPELKSKIIRLNLKKIEKIQIGEITKSEEQLQSTQKVKRIGRPSRLERSPKFKRKI